MWVLFDDKIIKFDVVQSVKKTIERLTMLTTHCSNPRVPTERVAQHRVEERKLRSENLGKRCKAQLNQQGRFLYGQCQDIFCHYTVITKWYLNGQIWWLSIPNTVSETKICNLHPKSKRWASPSLLWESIPPPSPHRIAQLQTIVDSFTSLT